MKVLIDMPEIPKNDHQRWVLSHGGIVLDSLTNGEMFLTMFPQWKVDDLGNGMVKVEFNGYYEFFWKSWWDAKWGE